MGISIHAAGRTDVGRVRKNNEDAYVIQGATGEIAPSGALLAVSDGMGGAAAGEVASRMGLEALRATLAQLAGQMPPAEALTKSIEAAHAAVHEEAARNPKRRGMGATLTALLASGDEAVIGEVGDSRAYLIRGARIAQVTHDQSFVQMLIDMEDLSAEEASQSPYKNVILQALGKDARIKVALTKISLRRGDRLLLCTDGLSNKVSSEEMRAAFGAPTLEETCERLVATALERGGDDNITVIAASVDGDLPEARNSERMSDSVAILSEFPKPR